MSFDETRDERSAGEIDRRRVRGHRERRARTGRFDAFAPDEHRPAFVRRIVDRVPDARGDEERDGLRALLLLAAATLGICSRRCESE